MLCKQEKKKSSSYQPDFEEYSFLRVDLAENKAKMHSFNVHIHSMLNWINYSTVLPLCQRVMQVLTFSDWIKYCLNFNSVMNVSEYG